MKNNLCVCLSLSQTEVRQHLSQTFQSLLSIRHATRDTRRRARTVSRALTRQAGKGSTSQSGPSGQPGGRLGHRPHICQGLQLPEEITRIHSCEPACAQAEQCTQCFVFFPFLTLLLPVRNGLDSDGPEMPRHILDLSVTPGKCREGRSVRSRVRQKVQNVLAEWRQHTHLHLRQDISLACCFCLPAPACFLTSSQETAWFCTWYALKAAVVIPGSKPLLALDFQTRSSRKQRGWQGSGCRQRTARGG